jgi:NAD(P)-dependent dehydrogenase (short-subunit alcohol dehydrogenase family)
LFPNLARNLLSIGCNVAINYANSADRASKFVKELESSYPNVKFALIQADVGQKAACEKLVEETISQLGGLDVIVSNAGSLKCVFTYSL